MYLNAVKLAYTAGHGAEDVPSSFYINKLTQQHEDDFELINPAQEVSEKVEEYLDEREAEVKNKLSGFGPILSEQTWEGLTPNQPLRMFSDIYITSEPVMIYDGGIVEENIVVYLSSHQSGGRIINELRLVAKTKEDCDEFIGFLNEEITQISQIVEDYVELEDMKSGEELVIEDLNENSEITSWDINEPENDFEEEVQNTTDELIGPTLGNVEVEFESGNNEYDVVAMPMGRVGNKFAIEVKDFEKVEQQISEEERRSELSADNLQSKLINQPKISAERSNLQLIMVVNQIPDETYQNLLRQANPLGVTLLNDENYKDGLEDQLVSDTLKAILR